MKTYLIFDVSYLAYRAFHSTGGLSHDGLPTGVLFGVFAEVLRTMERFDCYNPIFCFDVGKPKRRDILPGYKGSRRKGTMTDEQYEARKELKASLELLREDMLPFIGFRNIFWATGYEADDLIATAVKDMNPDEEAIMVSSDEDLYQLLGPRCLMWNPHKGKPITEKSFEKEYGITPGQWAHVKAMAGCSSDDVPGIQGVGTKTAIKWIRRELKPGKIYDRILLNDTWQANMELVRLPFADCPTIKKKRDKVTVQKWHAAMDEFGFESLKPQVPIAY